MERGSKNPEFDAERGYCVRSHLSSKITGSGRGEKESAPEWKYTATKDVGTGEATVVVTVNDLE